MSAGGNRVSVAGYRTHLVTALVTFVIGVSAGSPAQAVARRPLALTPYSPAIGLTSGQVARLTVVNDGVSMTTETLTFLDVMGVTLTTRMVSIGPGHRASLDYTTADARQEIYGTVGPDVLPADIQVFDATNGRTMALVENFTLPTPATSDLTSPPVGIIAGQTARLSFVNDDASPVTQTMSILNAMGDVLATTMVSVDPGEVGVLDYVASGPRQEIHAVLTIGPCIFPADLEVFDATTMRTTSLVENFRESPTSGGPFTSPSNGLAMGQVARLTAVNNGATTETETLSLVNSLGMTLVSKTFDIPPGRTASVQVVGRTSRLEVHGVINPCILPADVQIFDVETQKTISLVEVFRESPTSQATFTSPSIGLAMGQTARLGVINNGATTETETLSIVNGLGATIKTMTVDIAPGQMAFIQVAGGASRQEIHGRLDPYDSPPDLQVFDSASKKTLAILEVFRESPT